MPAPNGSVEVFLSNNTTRQFGSALRGESERIKSLFFTRDGNRTQSALCSESTQFRLHSDHSLLSQFHCYLHKCTFIIELLNMNDCVYQIRMQSIAACELFRYCFISKCLSSKFPVPEVCSQTTNIRQRTHNRVQVIASTNLCFTYTNVIQLLTESVEGTSELIILI